MRAAADRSATWQAAPGQERHWAYHQRFPDAAGFNIPIASQVSGPVDLGSLIEAISAVAGRHEVLRTRFVPDGGRLAQVVGDPADVPVLVHDLRGADEADRVREVRRIGAAEAARPFALSEEPASRVHLVRVAAEELVMVLNVHHIAFDGWSSPIFFAELDDQYSALVTGAAPRRQQSAHRYVDFARWQRRQIAAGRYDDQLAYWREKLADPPPALPWPTEGVDPDATWWAGDMVWLSFDQRLVTAARSAARAMGTTLFVLGLAAYQLTLMRMTGTEHLGIGTALAGRTHQRWEEVIGFFVNTAVLPFRSAGEQTFRELVALNHRDVLGAQDHQLLPYGALLDALDPPVELERTPYFQSMFLLQNYPSPQRRLGPARIRSRKLRTGSARYDITLALDTLDGELAVELENRVRLVSQDTAIAVARTFFGLLAAAVDAPDDPVYRLAPADVPTTVHRESRASAGMDELFDGLVADWR